MRRAAVGLLVVACLLIVAGTAWSAVTIITSGGSVLTGTIESGVPNTLSLTSVDGDLFTVQKANLKHIRFMDDGSVTIETQDGNILVGTVAGISEVLGLRTELGDVQSINVESITEMRFDAAVVVTAPVVQPTQPTAITVPSTPAPLVDSIKAVYGDHRGSITLGLDSGFQLGYSSLNGFGLPRFTVGVNAILLAPLGRLYFPPSVSRVARVAESLIADGISHLEPLLELTAESVIPLFNPYIQVGVDMLAFPHIGGGILIRLSPMFYFDIGGTIDTFGVPWPNFGLMVFF